MKSLLIIGAGEHGQVVAEIAEDCGYDKIGFLDDNSDMAIGKVKDISLFVEEYGNAFVGIGNNEVREKLIHRLDECGYDVVTLIHPTAYVSRSAVIGAGVLVEPKAVINAHTVIGDGTIVGLGAIIDHNAVMERCCHINSGAIVMARAKVPAYRKIDAGEVIRE